MAYNPGEPRDKDGKWTSGGGRGKSARGDAAHQSARIVDRAPSGSRVNSSRKNVAEQFMIRPRSEPRHGSGSRNIHKALPLAKVAKALGSNPKGLLNSVREARNMGYQSFLHISIPSNGSTLSTRERAHNRIADAQSKAARLYHKRNPR